MPSPDFIYLASQSPRRRELLAQIGVAHELLLPTPDEDAESLEVVLPGEAPDVYVQRVTALKLIAARARLVRDGGQNRPILCADTTVAMGDTILGKPEDAEDAQRMLRALSGQTHRVFTAITIGWGDKTAQACCESRVTFAQMSDAEIADYVASGEPMGKAGAYGVQGRAAAFIARIEGSYSGIMGLPLFETAQALREVGFACNKTS
ncbi:nucleoside triphosphate pyrophosphatase [Rhodoferax sp. TS-BS-61-7]|uniref:Maf family protein n=1 Tax=Rhodoferax sp. TS-BS-61-7 TaxID=2094194 RepID=UPI000CF6269B|nr:Maf family protein [Rhodoferax sp. TS-BS-61-7]PQA78280.1 septum formation inhibitor Maf [Rhodoferax sp. TS-BS-61-7]